MQMGDEEPEPYVDLSHLGVRDIAGLALEDAGTLLVVDRARAHLLQIAGWER